MTETEQRGDVLRGPVGGGLGSLESKFLPQSVPQELGRSWVTTGSLRSVTRTVKEGSLRSPRGTTRVSGDTPGTVGPTSSPAERSVSGVPSRLTIEFLGVGPVALAVREEVTPTSLERDAPPEPPTGFGVT